MHLMHLARNAAAAAVAALALPALAGATTASLNPAPYDGTGVIIQGPSCLLYQDDASGTVFNNADAGGFGVFGVGDHVRIVAEQYPCFFPSCSGVACINSITLIEAFGAGNDPTTAFCFGDGSTAACPCANESGVGDGEGCENSGGVGAILSGVGSDLLSDDNLVLTIEQGRANQPCVFVQGATQIATPFRDGVLCMGNPTDRLELAFLDSSGAASTTSALGAEGNVTPGQTVHYQVWYRDPAISPCGSGSNLSNGVSMTWL